MREKPLTLNVPYKVMVTGLDWPYSTGKIGFYEKLMLTSTEHIL